MVAGVGLVTAGLTVVAPGANAGPGDREVCGTGFAAAMPDPQASAKIAKIKQLIADKKYEIPAEKIADKMVDEHLKTEMS